MKGSSIDFCGNKDECDFDHGVEHVQNSASCPTNRHGGMDGKISIRRHQSTNRECAIGFDANAKCES